jgi:hypothetical protein
LIENINARQSFPFEEFETGAAAGVDKYNILSVAAFIFIAALFVESIDAR